jgi:hypothetical protein
LLVAPILEALPLDLPAQHGAGGIDDSLERAVPHSAVGRLEQDPDAAASLDRVVAG